MLPSEKHRTVPDLDDVSFLGNRFNQNGRQSGTPINTKQPANFEVFKTK